jgi:GNAT superfamily N-acetyltransferase
MKMTNDTYCVVLRGRRTMERYYRDKDGWLKVSSRGRVFRMTAEQVLNHLLPALAFAGRLGLTVEVRHYDGPYLQTAIRPVRPDEHGLVLTIINEAAQRYRGVIPADRWHDPYFSAGYLESEIAAGVRFFGYEAEGELLGVMGVQDVDDVTLIRHAYVAPRAQRRGIGGELLRSLLTTTDKPILIGTWADATWAIAFYEKHGFACVTVEEKNRLLRRYWDIPERQVETSVVLAERRHETCDAGASVLRKI